MPKKGANISLSSYDDIFSTEETREAAAKEQVQQIPISELHPFEGHPFRVVDDESMTRTMESIAQFGVIAPLLARPDPDGGYEIISGHRRRHAAELVGLETLPVIVRDMSDDEAIIAMVDSNLQRETILPSERAWAYKMKLDAIKHQGKPTSRQVGEKSWSVSQVSAASNDSERQVHRYIRLTNLLPELMDMVDKKKIALNPAVEISHLSRYEQSKLIEAMDFAQATPSLSQAQRLKKLSQEKKCTPEAMKEIMNEVKKGDLSHVTFKADDLRKYFPKSYGKQIVALEITGIKPEEEGE
ncbi:MAG: ParB/RepB/Spo0J family partition protein [Lachnospiraceae bacterium]|nr:ParB/RepB/Spo0J family partition protein [Lachnospiraceae bacterium]